MKTTKKALSVLLAVLMLAGCLGLLASAVNVLSSIELTCPAPVAGGAFPTVADVECSTALKVNSIYIYEVNDNVSVKATAPFEAGKTYEIDFNVATKTSSYNFDTNLSASVNGEGCRAVYLSKTSANVVWVVTVSSASDVGVGAVIEFGDYPQTEVEETTALQNAANAATWMSYDYYTGTGSLDGLMAPSDFMKYADFLLNGVKYRAVKFTEYRPSATHRASGANESYQDDNGYEINTIYYFKYGPLRWRVISAAEGGGYLLMCDSLIDSQAYQNEVKKSGSDYYAGNSTSNYANNYAVSSIRTWLNDAFYNTAFSDAQKTKIKQTTINNNAAYDSDARYNSPSTTDKIFLLSFSEAQNSSYGFSSDSSRVARGTDYAKCQGLHLQRRGYGEDYSSEWLLRSAGYTSYYSSALFYDGGVYVYNSVCDCSGIRPVTVLRDLSATTVLPTVTVSASPAAGGTVTGGGVFDEDATATVTATPKSGYHFTGWYNGDSMVSSDADYSFTVTENVTLVAQFEINTYTLTVIAGAGGTVTGGGIYEEGAYAFVTATPNNNYIFKGWYYDENLISSEESIYVHVEEDITITAKFTELSQFVDVKIGTDGLKDKDWYLDLDALVHDLTEYLIGLSIDAEEAQSYAQSVAESFSEGSITQYKYNPNTKEIFFVYELSDGSTANVLFEPGVDNYIVYGGATVKQYTAPTQPDNPGQPDNPQQPDNPGDNGGNNQNNNQNANRCHWCGKDHSGNFFQKIIGFFHSILALIFGKKY